MSRRFLLDGGSGCYHVVSRVVDRRFVFGEGERARFRELMGDLLGFSGLECLTYCLMSNHFHLLVSVPDGEVGRAEMGDEEFFRRLGCIYPPDEVGVIRQRLDEMHRESAPLAEAYRGRFLRRMFSLPVFVQELKRRFSQWYNREHGRCGTLWEERYRSVVVEDGRALAAVAAYIDLNPVRSGLEAEPGRFRWSGFGEAIRGEERARAGLSRILDQGSSQRGWDEIREVYGAMLALQIEPATGAAQARGGGGKAAAGASPGAPGRIRALTEGLAVGGRDFLDGLFRSHRGWFGPRRRNGAREIRRPLDSPGSWGGLACLRDLR